LGINSYPGFESPEQEESEITPTNNAIFKILLFIT